MTNHFVILTTHTCWRGPERVGAIIRDPNFGNCLKLTNTNIENDKKAVDQFLFCGPLLHVGGQV